MKTIRDTVLGFPGVADAEEFLDTVLVDRSLDGAANYIASNKSVVRLAAADVYSMIGGLPDFSENKLSMTYPRSWYTQKAKELYVENGEPEKAAKLGKNIKVPRGKASRSW
ncbi:hypothetical protein [Bacteroides ihuae]|uniref:hypothetical protein n=1 Tax=Bacteroides ihuae TaxID=1852362 RepID=UPI0008DA3195|nr:hypothetical protein [Bacteroides ihuae]